MKSIHNGKAESKNAGLGNEVSREQVNCSGTEDHAPNKALSHHRRHVDERLPAGRGRYCFPALEKAIDRDH